MESYWTWEINSGDSTATTTERVFRGIYLFIFWYLVRVIDIHSVISNYKSINSRRVINVAIQSILFSFDGDNKRSWNCNYPGVFVKKKVNSRMCWTIWGVFWILESVSTIRVRTHVTKPSDSGTKLQKKTKLRMTTFVILSCAANNMQYAFRRWMVH